MYNTILAFFIVFGLLAALYAVNTSSVVKAIFAMFATFFSVSGLLVLAHAEFLAIAHLMIYIGGIIVVMIFAMMLSSKDSLAQQVKEEKETSTFKFTKLIAGIASIAVFVLLAKVILSSTDHNIKNTATDNSVNRIGIELLSNYAFPLEIVSLILLVALMAASIITRKERDHA